jgi:hypothetical protein
MNERVCAITSAAVNLKASPFASANSEAESTVEGYLRARLSYQNFAVDSSFNINPPFNMIEFCFDSATRSA